MNAREERGLVIAALCKLKNEGGTWIVPSQSSTEMYRVNPAKCRCSCPDHMEHGDEAGFKCKHIFAVEFTMKREVASDGTVTETKTMTFTEKKTYKQNWPAYEAAQSVEKDRVQELLAELVRGIPEPDRSGIRGQKPHSLRDALFTIAFKVYSTISSRRFASDLREAQRRGHVGQVLPSQKISDYLSNPAMTPILKHLIAQSALPLKAVEKDFAIDSSGFSSSKFERWFDQKYGITRQKCVWVKIHLACGVKTNVVTAVRILDKDAADCPQFSPLLQETRKGFTIGEVSADKAYASLENLRKSRLAAGRSLPPSSQTRRAESAGCLRRCSITSSSRRTSSWPTITSGRMSNRLSQPSNGSSATTFGARAIPAWSTRCFAKCWFITWSS
jgi:hypothetical protein